MSRELSLFADYRAKENLSTNHCGLILKLLYQDNPKAFSKFLSEICSEAVEVGVQFTQQEVGIASVPDLVIRQNAIQIVFEAKTSDWFYSDQLERHLESFKTSGCLNVLIALSNFENDDYREKFETKHEEVFTPVRL